MTWILVETLEQNLESESYQSTHVPTSSLYQHRLSDGDHCSWALVPIWAFFSLKYCLLILGIALFCWTSVQHSLGQSLCWYFCTYLLWMLFLTSGNPGLSIKFRIWIWTIFCCGSQASKAHPTVGFCSWCSGEEVDNAEKSFPTREADSQYELSDAIGLCSASPGQWGVHQPKLFWVRVLETKHSGRNTGRHRANETPLEDSMWYSEGTCQSKILLERIAVEIWLTYLESFVPPRARDHSMSKGMISLWQSCCRYNLLVIASISIVGPWLYSCL